MSGRRVAVVGATGGLGSAFVDALLADASVDCVHACARSPGNSDSARLRWHPLDLLDPASIASAASAIAEHGPLDLVLIATGVLWGAHGNEQLQPEKSFNQLTAANMETVFRLNTIGPALVLQQFMPPLRRDDRAVAAALSARVGSISDNRLGGWHSYRASKAALNMLIKGAAIEQRRINPISIVVGLHPGTVATDLSAPFRKNVAAEKLFTPAMAAQQLLQVLGCLTADDSGRCFAWDGKEVLP
jgi:NAD(P)-dependent dehydrogenase (short-subunit alcohol dehydrogenase family)